MGRPAGYWVNKIRTSFKGGSSNKSDEGSGSGSGSGSCKKDVIKPTSPESSKEESKNGTDQSGRKVMLVVDATSQSKNALQWALIHCVQDEDSIILLHVIKTPRAQALGEETQKERESRAYEQVHPLKNLCQLKKPNVKTEIMVVEAAAEEKGKTIVEETKKQGVGVLVMGQRKRQSRWRVIWRWRGTKNGNGGIVEHCIHNTECMAIAVRKKSNNGGYLITTKRHKDFWLLA
ncbi:PREDICTED: universal stress protein PHOS32-like [Tarenaya hassleriana]|uniref:universal stress protein PHOS32-like n=1 Tax=Tarenaya hassleriana TaxID=28532 RepID=UPI0008FD728E|nr:PREDICTED: universal stress protein PHOS32-like [Tarenaya hassleriana]